MLRRKKHRARTDNAAARYFLSLSFLVFFFSLSPAFSRGEPATGFSSAELSAWADADAFLGQRRRSTLVPEFLWERYGLSGHGVSSSLKRGRFRLWTHGFVNWSQISDHRLASVLDTRSSGLSIGAEQQFGRRFLLGIGFGGNWSKLKRKGDFDNEDISAAYGSLYFRTTLQRLYFDAEVGLGTNDVSYLSTSPFQWNVNVEAGTWWEHGLGKVEPYLGLRHVSLDDDRTNESKTTLLAGLRYSWMTKGVFAQTSPRFYIGAIQELGDRNLIHTAFFSDAPTVFSLSEYKIGKTRFFCGGGFTSSMGSSLDLYLRYTAEIASDDSSHSLMLGMNWNF